MFIDGIKDPYLIESPREKILFCMEMLENQLLLEIQSTESNKEVLSVLTYLFNDMIKQIAQRDGIPNWLSYPELSQVLVNLWASEFWNRFKYEVFAESQVQWNMSVKKLDSHPDKKFNQILIQENITFTWSWDIDAQILTQVIWFDIDTSVSSSDSSLNYNKWDIDLLNEGLKEMLIRIVTQVGDKIRELDRKTTEKARLFTSEYQLPNQKAFIESANGFINKQSPFYFIRFSFDNFSPILDFVWKKWEKIIIEDVVKPSLRKFVHNTNIEVFILDGNDFWVLYGDEYAPETAKILTASIIKEIHNKVLSIYWNEDERLDLRGRLYPSSGIVLNNQFQYQSGEKILESSKQLVDVSYLWWSTILIDKNWFFKNQDESYYLDLWVNRPEKVSEAFSSTKWSLQSNVRKQKPLWFDNNISQELLEEGLDNHYDKDIDIRNLMVWQLESCSIDDYEIQEVSLNMLLDYRKSLISILKK